jgi:hypothetical protein
MTSLATRAFAATAGLFAVMALTLFVPPWTLDWWQAWLFLTVHFGGSIALMLDLLKRDPAPLERRMKAGPLAEERFAQKIIMLFASVGFVGLLVVAALDRRYMCRPSSP